MSLDRPPSDGDKPQLSVEALKRPRQRIINSDWKDRTVSDEPDAKDVFDVESIDKR
jgi:hypothetical protein